MLLDNAAQQSLISRKVVDDHKLQPIGRDYTTLVGFGSSKPKPRYYDVVR